jgi:peptide chain release factor subunit 1
MISIIMPQGGQISRVAKMLTEEAGTASNIKSRVNRLSVLAAITSAQQKLKLFTRVSRGCGLFVGSFSHLRFADSAYTASQVMVMVQASVG